MMTVDESHPHDRASRGDDKTCLPGIDGVLKRHHGGIGIARRHDVTIYLLDQSDIGIDRRVRIVILYLSVKQTAVAREHSDVPVPRRPTPSL